ncbi:MAG: acyl-CoA synthetase, partial [Rhizobacter sp.]|nr:acyl-CoA synthetase [Rhizobacter sp.]
MSHPSHHAVRLADKPAVIMAGSGHHITYGELEARSNQGAQALRAVGMKPGDHIAILMENQLRYYEVYWAAQRCGLYITPLSSQLTAAEAAYIANDCGATVLVSSKALEEVAAELPRLLPQVKRCLMVDGTAAGFDSWEHTLEGLPTTPVADEVGGHHMFYSSGTTGHPKGIKVAFGNAPIDRLVPVMERFAALLGFDENTVYLSPAPLYHAAPLSFTVTVLRFGGTVVLMEKFDAEAYLRYVQQYRPTHTQLVPTMFVRMLKLPKEVRERYDVSSLRSALHAAAPCPVAVKQQMIDWWGPCIVEQYSGSEGNGMTFITTPEWLAHRGSVGRAMLGEIRITAPDGSLAPVGEPGAVYFAGGRQFVYH